MKILISAVLLATSIAAAAHAEMIVPTCWEEHAPDGTIQRHCEVNRPPKPGAPIQPRAAISPPPQAAMPPPPQVVPPPPQAAMPYPPQVVPPQFASCLTCINPERLPPPEIPPQPFLGPAIYTPSPGYYGPPPGSYGPYAYGRPGPLVFRFGPFGFVLGGGY
jgi:hypothetical protein